MDHENNTTCIELIKDICDIIDLSNNNIVVIIILVSSSLLSVSRVSWLFAFTVVSFACCPLAASRQSPC